jgi:hypothetical protein
MLSGCHTQPALSRKRPSGETASPEWKKSSGSRSWPPVSRSPVRATSISSWLYRSGQCASPVLPSGSVNSARGYR